MVQITDWDAAEHLRDEADISAYLEAAFEDGDAGVIVAALDDATRARELLVAATNGTERVPFYRFFDSDPRLSAVTQAVNVLGYRLSLSPVHGAVPSPSAQ
jgi:probable addiction module antidote protein